MDLKLGRLAQVALSVADMDRSVAFFEGQLGLKLLFRPHETMAFFDLNGVRLYVQKAARPEDIEKASLLYLLCDDIAVAAAELAGRGVPFIDKPHRIAEQPTYDLWLTFFRDPDGHLIALEMQAPKGWAPA